MGQSCTRDASIDNDGAVVSTHRTTPPPTTSSSSPASGLAISNKRRQRRTASTSTTSTSSNNNINNSYSTNRKRSDGGTTTNYGDTTVNATEDEDVLSTERDERKRSGGTPPSLGGGCVEGTISSRDVIVLTGSGTEQQQQTPSLHNNNNQEINSSGKDQSLVPVMVDKNQSISLSEATGRLTSGSASASLRSASLLGEDEGGVSIGSAIIGGGGRRRRRVLATGYIPGSISSTTSAFGKGSPTLGVVGSPAASINSRGGGGGGSGGGVRSSTMYSSIVNRVSPSELLKMSPTEAEERSPVIRGRRSRGHHPQQILPSQTNHHVRSRSGSQAMIDGVVGVSSGSNSGGGGGGVFSNSFPASAGTSKRRSIPSGSNGSSAAIEDSPATKLLFGSAPEEEDEEATMMKLDGTHPPPLIRQRTAGQNGMEGSLNHHHNQPQQTLQLHTSVLEAPNLMSALPNNSQQLQQNGESTTPIAHPPLTQTAATSSSTTREDTHPLTTIFIPAEASGDLDSDHTSTTILPNAISISASSPLAAAAVRPANGYQSSSSSTGFITDMGMLSPGGNATTGIRGLVLGGSGSTPAASSSGAFANGTTDKLYQSIQTYNTGSSDGSDIGEDELLLNGSFVNTDMRAIAGLSEAMVAREMAMMEESGGGGGGGDSSAAVSCNSMSEKKMRSRARSRARSIRQVLAASLSAKNSTSPMRQQPYSCNVLGGGMDTPVDPSSGGDGAQPHNNPLPSVSNDYSTSGHNQLHPQPQVAPQQQQHQQSHHHHHHHHHHSHQNQQHMALALPSLVENNTQSSKRSSIVDTGAVTPNIHSEGGGGASFTTMEVFNDIVPIGLVVDSSPSSSQLNR